MTDEKIQMIEVIFLMTEDKRNCSDVTIDEILIDRDVLTEVWDYFNVYWLAEGNSKTVNVPK